MRFLRRSTFLLVSALCLHGAQAADAWDSAAFAVPARELQQAAAAVTDRKSTRLNSSHL